MSTGLSDHGSSLTDTARCIALMTMMMTVRNANQTSELVSPYSESELNSVFNFH